MMRLAPRVITWTKFSQLGFYDVLSLEKCILRAMGKNLELTSELVQELPSREVLVGRFHHFLMESSYSCETFSELEVSIEERIQLLQEEVDALPHLKKNGSVSGWKEVNRSANIAYSTFKKRDLGNRNSKIAVERPLTSKDMIFVGRPDLFIVGHQEIRVFEFKSGRIFDENGLLRSEYRKQALFYSVLLHDNFEIEKLTATLESAIDGTISFPLSREETEAYRIEILDLMARSNGFMAFARTVADLAFPSEDSCLFCS